MSEFQVLEERVGRITARMTLREPFIASVFVKLNREFMQHGTAMTNGRIVRFGVDFCSKLDDEELLFVALHEGLHVVFMHMWRREGRRPDVFNLATDAVINRMLAQKGYKILDCAVTYPWVTDEMDAETVYSQLMKNPPPQPPQGSGTGDGDGEGKSGGGGFDGTGDLEDAPDMSDAADMEATILTAARMAKACGDGSAVIQRILAGELTPTVPWTDTLRHVMQAISRDDYSYRKFNRRMFPHGLYLPTLYSESMGGIGIGVDTSGSVGQRELDQIASEITAIMEDCNPEWVEVVYCDTRVTHTERFERGEPIVLHAKGGGGTKFKPVFEHFNSFPEKIAALVYLTDLEGNTKECDEPDYPVVWAVTTGNSDSVPFGHRVEVRV